MNLRDARASTTTGARLQQAGNSVSSAIQAAVGGPGWAVKAGVSDLLIGLALLGALLVYWYRRVL
jgi:hypothetical protein